MEIETPFVTLQTSLVARYIYEKLPSNNHIRLLELQPGEQSTAIKCHLFIVPLGHLPSYEAISYVWGDNNIKVDVICDEKFVSVTPNLLDALYRIRLPRKKRILWADAICINQADVEERSKQVRLMREIFRGAQTILSWLGSARDEDMEAFPLIRLMERTAQEIPGLLRYERGNSFVRYARLRSDAYLKSLPSFDESCWTALIQFFDRPYFYRVWIMREINKMESILMLCGKEEMGFECVACAARLLFDVVTYRLASKMAVTSTGMTNVLKLTFSNLSTLPLLDALRFARRFESSDPRDKVYAVINWDDHNDKQSQIVPDYSKSVVEVYRDTAHMILEETNNLSVLTHVHHNIIPSPSCPSWVPQWNIEKRSNMIGLCNVRLNSSGDIQHIPTGSVGDFLSVRGIRIDEVSSHDPPHGLEETKITGNITNVLSRIWERYLDLRLEAQTQQTKAKLVTTFTLTLVAGTNFGELNDACLNLSKHNVDAAAFMLRILQLSPESSVAGTKAKRHPSLIHKIAEEASGGYWKDFEASFRNVSFKRVLFETRYGDVGLGPETVKLNDQVWVLFGSRNPFLLRPKNEYYQVVGECYVDRLMEGQAVTQLREGKLTAENIQLC